MSEFDLHKTEGLCSHCGAVIVCRCCGPFEGEWRVEFDAWGDVCPARPDTGPLEHEPRRSNDGRLLPPSEVRSTDTTKDPRERAEYLAASNADAAMGDWRPANETGEDQ